MFGSSRNSRSQRTTGTTPRSGGLFGSSRTSRAQQMATGTGTSSTTSGQGLFGNQGTRSTGTKSGLFSRANPNRQAGGYKSALHNPNTTRGGRRNAKNELGMMGRGNEAHGSPSMTSRFKSMLGMNSNSRTSRSGY